MLLHRILQLVRVVALGAGPGGLALRLVEVGDEQHPDLPLQLLVVRSRLARSARLLHHRLAHLVELHLEKQLVQSNFSVLFLEKQMHILERSTLGYF